MRRKKSLFFFFRIPMLVFAVLIIAFFCLSDKNSQILSKKDFFAQSQYFFPKIIKTSESVDFNVFQGAFLSFAGPPFLVSGKKLASLNNSSIAQEVMNYIVESGDTAAFLAEKFNISVDTVLLANNLSKSSILKPGDKLVILPVTGALHIVGPGDVLSVIAASYKANSEDIIEINGLDKDGRIFIGDMLIIPGGIKPSKSYNFVQVPLPGNYFICPIPAPCRVSQGLHWYNAIDFSNGKCGEPVFAAAGGVVQRTGYGSMSGNYVRIEHANSVVSFYGHLSKIAVSAGQKVSQGQIVGYIGYTGLTVPAGPAGCHLHFDVRFAKNPFSIYQAGAKLAK